MSYVRTEPTAVDQRAHILTPRYVVLDRTAYRVVVALSLAGVALNAATLAAVAWASCFFGC